MTDFYTDGMHLYEVASERRDRNYGLAGGEIVSVVLRDCVSEETGAVGRLEMVALTPVRQA